MYIISLKNLTKWWSYSVEGLLSTGPSPSSLIVDDYRFRISHLGGLLAEKFVFFPGVQLFW